MRVKACKNHTRIIVNGSWWRVLNEDWDDKSSYLSSVEHFCTVRDIDPDHSATRRWNLVYKTVLGMECKYCKQKAPARVRAYVKLLNQSVPGEKENFADILDRLQKQMQQAPKPQSPWHRFPGPAPSNTTIGPHQVNPKTTTVEQHYNAIFQKQMQQIELENAKLEVQLLTGKSKDGK